LNGIQEQNFLPTSQMNQLNGLFLVQRIFDMAQRLKVDSKFTPCRVDDGDELFPNGIFEFNVTRILEHIAGQPTEIDLVELDVKEFCQEHSMLEQSHVESVDLSQPVVLAEIAPGHYNLIDGHHRIEKARRLGIDRLRAYKLKAHQHIGFLTTRKAYLAYVEYWNGKVDAGFAVLRKG
jgi:hypothetical protein